jgi:DUF1365 family protein
MIDSHKLYRGTIFHERLFPVYHKFSYPFTFFHFNLHDLQSLSEKHAFFGYNKKCLLEIRDIDYLRAKPKPIQEQLLEFLSPEKDNEKTLIFTSPKYLGVAFNPVNFYFRINKDTELLQALVEVNNTFGDRHLYPLCQLQKKTDGSYKASSKKTFHVSPFNPMDGEYHFTFKLNEQSVLLGIDLYENEHCKMKTYMQGQAHTLDSRQLIRYCLMHPLDTALNAMPRILFQASVLSLRKKLKVFSRPRPVSKDTIIDDTIHKDPNSKL